MLARGWLAYPVTPIHSLLPPKSGCINVITRFALSRRRATALFRNPVCKAQRSVPGFSSTPTSACRRYATSPPSAVASPIKKPALINGLRQRRNAEKTAEERFHMLARGWLAYPVTPIHSLLPPKSGCICQHIPRLANNLYNRSSAVDSSFYNQPQVGKPTWGYIYPTALRRLPHPSKKTPSSTDCVNGAMRKKPPKSGFIC